MAGVAGAVLAPADAAEFRARLGRRKEQKALTTDNIVALEPARSRRWFYLAMAENKPLLVANAVDLAARMQTLGARLPEDLIRKLQRPAPVFFMPPGEAEALVDALVPLCGLTGTARKRVHSVATKFFRRYERVAQTPTIAAAFAQIKSELGGDPHWRRVFGQLLSGRVETIAGRYSIGKDGVPTEGIVAPSALAVAQEQHPPKRRKASK